MSALALGLSFAIAALLAIFVGRVLVSILRVVLVIAAIVLLLSVWHRGTLPWCGKDAVVSFPHAEKLCP